MVTMPDAAAGTVVTALRRGRNRWAAAAHAAATDHRPATERAVLFVSLHLRTARRDAVRIDRASDGGIVAAGSRREFADPGRIIDTAEHRAFLATRRASRAPRNRALRLRVETAGAAEIVPQPNDAAHVLPMVAP